MTDSTINKYFTPVNPSQKRPKPNSSPEAEVGGPGGGMVSDMEKVGELTKGQLMSDLTTILGTLLDSKLANVATKNDLAQLSEKVSKIDVENEAQREEIDNLKSQNKAILNKLLDLESRSRRNNLIFRGLKYGQKTSDYRYVVESFCSSVMGNNKIVVNRAHPLGRDQNAIIAHIPYDPDIEYIMSRVKDLKGTGYSVHRDFPKEVRVKRACLAAVRAEVEKIGGQRRMPLVFDHLTINRCRFTWEEGRLMAGQRDGVTVLNDMFQHDFTAAVEALKHRPTRTNTTEDDRGSGSPAGQRTTARVATATGGGGGDSRTATYAAATAAHNTDG
jgi:hypothetical protein